MMQHSYDKSNNVFYYRDRGRKVATSATVEGLDKKLIDLGYKVKPRKETSQVTVQDAFKETPDSCGLVYVITHL